MQALVIIVDYCMALAQGLFQFRTMTELISKILVNMRSTWQACPLCIILINPDSLTTANLVAKHLIHTS